MRSRNMKRDLLEWAAFNRHLLGDHELCATGTTGRIDPEDRPAPVVQDACAPQRPE
jgi:methylglyoxal synthase